MNEVLALIVYKNIIKKLIIMKSTPKKDEDHSVQEIEKKVDFLNTEINNHLSTFEEKRVRNRKIAIFFKILSSTLGAVIAVLLGLKLGDNFKGSAVNIALILGSLISIINAIEIFWNPSSLWVKYTMTSNELRGLRTDIKYLMKKDINNINIKEIDAMYENYRSILKETNIAWEHVRAKLSK